MTLVFPLAAFALALAGTLRSLGWGFVAVLAVGYVNGVIRANFLGTYTTFMFDAALAGLYAGFFAGRAKEAAGLWGSAAGQWAVALIGWPVFLTLMPANDYLVQLVALRATVWFLPVLLIAVRLTPADLAVLTRGLAGLNLVALAGGVYVYARGVEALYPENAVTQIIYMSNDVAGYTAHRVPSFFLSAHAYGGAMLFTLPLLIDRLFGPRVRPADRWLAGAGVAAAAGGMLLCATRQPVVTFVAATLIAWVCSRFNVVFGFATLALVTTAAGIAATDERLQRAADLVETERVSERVRGSANEAFIELLADYPVGAGMGSSVGTSIPYFLADVAPTPIGLENEYCRILVDQGWVGLALWLGFLAWLFVRPPPARLAAPWGIGLVLMYALCLTNWATAFIGVGTLSAVPMSVLLLAQMGILVGARR